MNICPHCNNPIRGAGVEALNDDGEIVTVCDSQYRMEMEE